MTPANLEPYTEEHDEETLPSGVKHVPPTPPEPEPPTIAIPPADLRELPSPGRVVTRAAVWLAGLVLTGTCLAWSVAFVVDYADSGWGIYGMSVVLASAALGALGASGARWVRGK